MKDCLVYVSGPITPKNGYTVEENTAAAVKVYLQLLGLGIPAFCPHLSAAFPSAFSDIPYNIWMEYDFAVIARCTHILMLPRWEASSGAKAELEYARSLGLPICFSTIELKEALGCPAL